MMEFIFFDESLRNRFVEQAKAMEVICELRDDTMGMVVAVADDLDSDLLTTLEGHYESLQDEQSGLLAQSEGGFKSLAGFSVVLPDGQRNMVPLQPEMANRLLACFSMDEIQLLFSTVARSVLEPQNEHLCHILRGASSGN